jgi:hypothetical protein
MYASRLLNRVEYNYSTLKKEALTIVFALYKFIHYLLGNKFLIYYRFFTLNYFELNYLINLNLYLKSFYFKLYFRLFKVVLLYVIISYFILSIKI